MEQMKELLERVADVLSIPFTYVVSAQERVYWLYLLAALMIAFLFYFYQMKRARGAAGNNTSFLTNIWSVFLHRSAKVDYVYFFVNRIIIVALVSPIILKLGFVADMTLNGLTAYHEPLNISFSYPLIASVIFTLVAVMFADFFIFIAHYLQHRVPYFWEFHKVHHSAEVLTPMTIYRMHPMDDILALGIGMVANSMFYGAAAFLFDSSIQLVTVANLNLFLFLFYVFGFNLRHSPVFISYGKFWEKIFISPALHQIHHSDKPEHYDRNYGFIFSLWDRMFGSLVTAKPGTVISYGIGGEEKEMQNVSTLYFRPFKKCFELIRRKKKR